MAKKQSKSPGSSGVMKSREIDLLRLLFEDFGDAATANLDRVVPDLKAGLRQDLGRILDSTDLLVSEGNMDFMNALAAAIAIHREEDPTNRTVLQTLGSKFKDLRAKLEAALSSSQLGVIASNGLGSVKGHTSSNEQLLARIAELEAANSSLKDENAGLKVKVAGFEMSARAAKHAVSDVVGLRDMFVSKFEALAAEMTVGVAEIKARYSVEGEPVAALSFAPIERLHDQCFELNISLLHDVLANYPIAYALAVSHYKEFLEMYQAADRIPTELLHASANRAYMGLSFLKALQDQIIAEAVTESPVDSEFITENNELYDFYDILGVDRETSAEDIKKAYRSKSLQFHPDRNPDNPEADAQFRLVNLANSVLSDASKKQRYDFHYDRNKTEE